MVTRLLSKDGDVVVNMDVPPGAGEIKHQGLVYTLLSRGTKEQLFKESGVDKQYDRAENVRRLRDELSAAIQVVHSKTEELALAEKEAAANRVVV